MEQQTTTWPDVSAAGDRWHQLQQQLKDHRQHTVELEQQVEQARQEFERGLALLGLPVAQPAAPRQSAASRASGAGLIPCANGCGQEIKPRGQTAHNRYCPKYVAPATTQHTLSGGSRLTLTAPTNGGAATEPASADVSAELAADRQEAADGAIAVATANPS